MDKTPVKQNVATVSAEAGRWNPYWVGIGIGALSWFAFGVVNQPLGISTALASASSVCALPLLGEEGVAQNAYWSRSPLQWDAGVLLLIGTFLGGILSTALARSFRWEVLPATWAQRFGDSKPKRLVAAFVGGVIIMFGARLAGGCTSGHGISGALQLALSSWTFFLTMFVSGLATAAVMFCCRSHKRS